MTTQNSAGSSSGDQLPDGDIAIRFAKWLRVAEWQIGHRTLFRKAQYVELYKFWVNNVFNKAEHLYEPKPKEPPKEEWSDE